MIELILVLCLLYIGIRLAVLFLTGIVWILLKALDGLLAIIGILFIPGYPSTDRDNQHEVND